MTSPVSPKAPYSEMVIQPGDEEIFKSFEKCLNLRDDYLKSSFQYPGDNPTDTKPREWRADPPVLLTAADSLSLTSATGKLTTASKHLISMCQSTLSLPNSLNNTNDQMTASVMSVDGSSSLKQSHLQGGASTMTASVNIGKTYILSTYDLDACFIPGPSSMSFRLSDDGVYTWYHSAETKEEESAYEVVSLKKYYQDLDYLVATIGHGPMKSFAYKRLKYLESLFNMYVLLNDAAEVKEQKMVPHRDFYNIRKVDTHVHHSACMNQKHLLRFIKSKIKKSPKDVVIYRDGKYLTLEEVFESLKLTAYDLSIDTLDMHAHQQSFHRFDIFNTKYNPIGESRLREIFLKTDNLIDGAYLSELTKEVISDLEASRYQMAEYRISIYGRSPDEWDKLAAWICDNQLFSDNVRWIIQIPRLYDLYLANRLITNFEDIIKNIFEPLFLVTQNPSSNPKLHIFLQRVTGFDSVDDESKAERRIHKKYPVPKDWKLKQNPPYSYYLYYIYANMSSLNFFRKERHFNTFVLRPHSGEAGDTEHLAAAYLTSHGISHGILLRKVPALQYLYYLKQVGIAMSPLSNNALFLKYERNPFPSYFRIGMNVSLSTDDPLQFHYTKEPLIEEYSVAAQIWKLSSSDLSEICRHSVLQSGFEMTVKKQWLGDLVDLAPHPCANNIHKSNVPLIRTKFRHDTLVRERSWILAYGKLPEPVEMETPANPILNHMALPPLDLSALTLEQDTDEDEDAELERLLDR